MRTTAKQGADTVYLCKAYSGGTFWTNGQCSKQQALIERIVTVPDGMPFDQQVNLAQQSRQEAERLSAPPPRVQSSFDFQALWPVSWIPASRPGNQMAKPTRLEGVSRSEKVTSVTGGLTG